MSAKGMVLVRGHQDSNIFRQPEAREVFDVSGAGDAVAAIVALGLASGAADEVTIDLANLAAGRVVEKWGTQPIYEHELLEAYLHRSQPVKFVQTDKKVTDLDHLLKQLKSLNFRSKEIVFTNGCFDILHVGHLTYLEKARSRGDVLVVGLNSDQSISRIKGPTRPIVEEKLRARLLAGLSCVDFVVQFDDDTPLELIKAIRPHILIKGADWAVDKIVGGDFVLAHGGRVETIDLVEGLSTTNIIQKSQQKK
jgi:D-beta-D-heptose 7-phosphate kinase/D-beta-D-heptose 1-phosphate adenosyltransferase